MKANERLSGLSFLVSFPLCAKGSEEEENGGRTSGITARRNVTACIIRDVCRSFSAMSNAPSKWLRLLTLLLRAAELDRAWSGDSGADSGSGADSSSSFSRPPLKPARKGSVRRQKRLQAPLAPMAASREAFFGPMRGIKADFPPSSSFSFAILQLRMSGKRGILRVPTEIEVTRVPVDAARGPASLG